MIRRRRHARFPAASGAAGGDTDALQTDVMRFMSIIGLCLMAVFALVQSIPAPAPDAAVQPSRAATLRPALQQEKLQKIRQRIQQEKLAQQQQAQQLQAELHALKSEKDQTQQILAVAQQRYEQVIGQIQQAREARARQEAQLETLQGKLGQGRKILADIEQASKQQEQDLGELRQRLLTTQTILTHSRREIEVIKQSPQPQADKPVIKKSSPPPANKPVPSEKTAPAKQGFTLRFASAGALDRLVTAGSVSLYGMVDQQAWRLSMDTGRLAVAQATFPGWFHEMSAATVPSHYVYSLDNAADGPGPSTVVWGVQLPTATKAAIKSLVEERRVQGQQGGTLVIGDNGQVLLEE